MLPSTAFLDIADRRWAYAVASCKNAVALSRLDDLTSIVFGQLTLRAGIPSLRSLQPHAIRMAGIFSAGTPLKIRDVVVATIAIDVVCLNALIGTWWLRRNERLQDEMMYGAVYPLSIHIQGDSGVEGIRGRGDHSSRSAASATTQRRCAATDSTVVGDFVMPFKAWCGEPSLHMASISHMGAA